MFLRLQVHKGQKGGWSIPLNESPWMPTGSTCMALRSSDLNFNSKLQISKLSPQVQYVSKDNFKHIIKIYIEK